MSEKKPWHKRWQTWIGVFVALALLGAVLPDPPEEENNKALEEEQAAKEQREADRKERADKIAASLEETQKKAEETEKALAQERADKEKKEAAEKERLANRSIDEKIKDAVVAVMGKENYRNHRFEDSTLWIEVNAQGNLTQNMVLKGSYMDTLDIAQSIQKESLLNGANDFDISYYTELTDVYGKTSDAVIVEIGMNKDTLNKIDFKNVLHKNVPTIADYYWEHPLFSAN